MAARQGILDIINNYDRPAGTYVEGQYTFTDTYANGFEDEPGKRVPKAGARAKAGVGRVGAAWSIYSAEAKGPNASASAEANILEAGAMARAELGRVSASAGPLSSEVKGPNASASASANILHQKIMAGAELGSVSSSAGPFSAEVKGPNASASAEANIIQPKTMARAALASASVSAGPVNVKLGLGGDTGVTVNPDNVELKLLGTGVTLGSTMGISLFGNEFKVKLW